MTDKVQKIREEVERLKEWQPITTPSLNKLLSFLDTMQEEPVSEDLEDVADKYSQSIHSDYSNDMFDRGDIYEAVIYGAKWQKQQTIEKACNWLDENLLNYWGQINANDTDEFIEKFRKAMKL